MHTLPQITYEVSSNESLHPDPTVVNRMRESGLGDCGYGCKIYSDPLSSVNILAHNRIYGCPK